MMFGVIPAKAGIQSFIHDVINLCAFEIASLRCYVNVK